MDTDAIVDDVKKISYEYEKMSNEDFYNNVILQKNHLEKDLFVCHWRFIHMGRENLLFLSPENTLPTEESPTEGIITSISKELQYDNTIHENFHLLATYNLKDNTVYLHGSTTMYGNKERYEKLISTIDEFKRITKDIKIHLSNVEKF